MSVISFGTGLFLNNTVDLISKANFKWLSGLYVFHNREIHYSDAIMSVMTSQIIGVSIVGSAVCSCVDQIKRQSSASLAFVRASISDRWISSHRASNAEMFLFDDVVMIKIHWWSKNCLDLRATLTPNLRIHALTIWAIRAGHCCPILLKILALAV